MDGDILEIGLGGGKGHAVAGDGPQAVDDACRQVAGAGHGPQEDLPLKGQEDRDYLLKELQGDAEKAGKAGNAVLRAAPAAVGGLDPGAGLTALAQEAVRPAEGAQHVKTGQQVLQFADALRLGGGAGLAQPFHPLLEQLGQCASSTRPSAWTFAASCSGRRSTWGSTPFIWPWRRWRASWRPGPSGI